MRKYHPASLAPIAASLNLLPSALVTKKLRVTRVTLCAWVRDGKLDAIRLPDHSYRFREAALAAWLQSHQVGGPQGAPVSVPLPNLLFTVEVMDRLGVTRDTLCGWVRGGQIRAYRLPDRAYRFAEPDVEAWLQSRQTGKSAA
jgi:excisionase family DNA binding protein